MSEIEQASLPPPALVTFQDSLPIEPATETTPLYPRVPDTPILRIRTREAHQHSQQDICADQQRVQGELVLFVFACGVSFIVGLTLIQVFHWPSWCNIIVCVSLTCGLLVINYLFGYHLEFLEQIMAPEPWYLLRGMYIFAVPLFFSSYVMILFNLVFGFHQEPIAGRGSLWLSWFFSRHYLVSWFVALSPLVLLVLSIIPATMILFIRRMYMRMLSMWSVVCYLYCIMTSACTVAFLVLLTLYLEQPFGQVQVQLATCFVPLFVLEFALIVLFIADELVQGRFAFRYGDVVVATSDGHALVMLAVILIVPSLLLSHVITCMQNILGAYSTLGFLLPWSFACLVLYVWVAHAEKDLQDKLEATRGQASEA